MARQDLIPNGITSRYTYNHLVEKSGSAFNSAKFYDFNEYLSQLVLLAQIVDDEFQQSIQQIFSIDKVTYEGALPSNTKFTENTETKSDDKTGDGFMRYMRGPVKLLERARNKAEQDYLDEEYPQSACILDLNRCALIFNDISTMLAAMNLFVNKIQYYQSGAVIGIVRAKNGFIEYVQSTQYADIKLNVLIRSKQNNIIGEVQFLLRRMKQYKDIAHNLYSIERTKDVIESSFAKILPLLLDEEKQLFIASNMGSVKKICKIMVVNNKSTQDIMKSNEGEQNILHNVCRFGHSKLFFYLKSVLPTESFVSYVLSSSHAGATPLERALQNNQISIVKDLLGMKQISDIYSQKQQIYRLLIWLFAFNTDMDFARYVLTALNIPNGTVSNMMTFQYPSPTMTFDDTLYHYDRYIIFGRIAEWSTCNALKTLVSIVGEKTFLAHALDADDYDLNTLETAVKLNKPKLIQYIVSFEHIQTHYAKNKELLFRLLCFAFYMDEDMIDHVLSALQIDKQMIEESVTYQYQTPSRQFGSDAVQWCKMTMITTVAINQAFEAFKKLSSVIGENVFIEHVLDSDGWGKNALEWALEKRKDKMVHWIISFEHIKKQYSTNKDLVFRLLCSVFYMDSNEIDRILSEMKINKAMIQELVMYRYPPPQPYGSDSEDSDSEDSDVTEWHEWTLLGFIAYHQTLESMKKIKSIIGEKSFHDGVFLDDGSALQDAKANENWSVIKYMLNIPSIETRCADSLMELYSEMSVMLQRVGSVDES
eukprot:463063_1